MVPSQCCYTDVFLFGLWLQRLWAFCTVPISSPTILVVHPCRDLLVAPPHLLPWLQQFACTSPAWQAALDSVRSDALLQLLKQMQNPERVERLQLIVR